MDLSGLVGTPDFSGQSSQQLETQEEQQLASLSKVVLADTETVWGQYFRQMGKTYSEPTMVLYNGVTPTACGTGQSAMVHSTARAIAKFTLIYHSIMK